jgi:hypothetical protein
MKLVYLIHAHKNIAQLNNLIELLADNDTKIYVNIDLKSKIDVSKINEKAHLIKKRIPIIWAHYSQTQAILNSIEEINKNEASYSHIIFISGQDFPIKPNAIIKNTIQKDKDYLEYCIVPTEWSGAKYRYERFHYQGKIKILRKIVMVFASVIRRLGYCRKIPGEPIPYGGSDWWIFTKDTIEYIISFVNDNANKTYINFFCIVVHTSELFFHIILCNSEKMKNIVNDNCRYIDWSERRPNPKNLDISDYEKIINSNKLFCRKIEQGVSDSLVEKLIEYRNNYKDSNNI